MIYLGLVGINIFVGNIVLNFGKNIGLVNIGFVVYIIGSFFGSVLGIVNIFVFMVNSV